MTMRPTFACAWLRVAERLLLTLVLLQCAIAAGAETAIKGIVKDRVTEAPLAGAEIEVRRGGAVLGRAISNAGDGSFLVTVEVGSHPEAVNLKLLVAREGYQSVDRDVVVASGRPRPSASAITLLRSDLADCMSKTRRHWVVVGHFRPPLGQADSEGFSQGVFDAVRWELSKIADTSSVALDRRPAVVACKDIDEIESIEAAARALSADVLLAGGVSGPADGSLFTVKMYVGDRHGLFAGRTTPILSRNVDLDNPSASRLDGVAAGAIVQALLTGYLKEGRFEECVELSRRAGSELQPLPPEIVRLNAECMGALPANGLRGGSQ
jgi:hypothetical protein